MDNQELVANLLKHPEKVQPAHASILKEMIAIFPYAQPFYALLAKADESFLPKAALFSNHNVLYNLVNEANDQSATEDLGLTATDDEKNVNDATEVESISLPDDIAVFDVETPVNLPGIDYNLITFTVDEDNLVESETVAEPSSFAPVSSNKIPDAPEIETVVPDEPEINFVSKYDDDQLPYTFLWWLAKTRKEHEQIFQPYAQPKPQAPNQQHNQVDKEFQQQYVEHIFHIQTPFEVADHLAEYPSTEIKDVKGAGIIEKFLKEDPIIKPPKPEQIDNENKAKKSAEDRYELVSETLAKIYIEQMLYHKAIDTYKKLSLKYPEKSRYFADLIQSIEKKL